MSERMTNVEVVKLSRAIRAGWPHQKFDEITTDLWAEGIRGVEPALSYENCYQAITRLVVHRTFAGPEAILEEVRRIRDDRIASTEPPLPNADPNNVLAYNAETAAIRAAIADGTFDAKTYQAGGFTLTGAPIRAAIEAGSSAEEVTRQIRVSGVFRRPPSTLPVDYGTDPVVVSKTVDPETAAAMERERTRQMALLEAMMQAAEGVDRG